MNSPSHRLDTVKPGLASVDIKDATPEPTPKQLTPPPLPPPKQPKRQGGFFQISEFQHSDFWTWANRFASGWLFSLLLHFLVLVLLGTVVTQWNVEGRSLPLIVSMSEAEEVETLTIDISPMELKAELETQPLEPTNFEDTQMVEVAVEVSILPELEPIDNDSILPDAAAEANMLAGVAVGGKGNGKGKGGGGKDGKGVKFFGVESSGSQFIFVIDCSGSMGNENRYQRAVYELGRSISMLENNHDFLVILYNTETIPMLEMTPATIQMVPATVINKGLVATWLNQQSPGSQTQPLLAMQTALALRPSAIFLLSDGEFNDRTEAMLQQTNAEDKSAGTKRIPINTISLGSSRSGIPTMKRIAKDNGGSFYWAQ